MLLSSTSNDLNLKTHLSILQDSSERFAHSAAFKIPSTESTSSGIPRWDTITFKQFHDDVELCARHWARQLNVRGGVPPKSVVGLWIGGYTYSDVLHIYGISKAGYVPQLFSLRLPNPTVIYELLQKAGAKALVCDEGTLSSIAGQATDSPVPIFTATSLSNIELSSGSLLHEINDSYLTSEEQPINPSDCAFVFHTSGSTSGSPKLVPCNYRWLDAVARKASQLCVPIGRNGQDVSTWIGSMCHIGQTTMLICLMQYGTCIVQPRRFPYPADELAAMVEHCNVNRIWQFSAFFSALLRTARQNPRFIRVLAGLDEVTTCGMALSKEDQDFAYKSGVNLQEIFGSTELGGSTLVSIGGEDPNTRRHLRPLSGLAYEFRPVHTSMDEDDLELDNAGHQSTNHLLEFVVSKDSGDCPDISLRNPEDGDFHTGDLFIEVGPGRYIFVGRDDDWIKTENSLRCDTKSIEDNARAMCGSLISDCIVVGTGRPSPVLFIENPATDVEVSKLKKDIWRKIRPFHKRRYVHESITSAEMIIVVPVGSLPRTASKGNIRRKTVEEDFRAQLDKLYGVSNFS
ncbi:acetyl-CoA synthetase-like protein [Lentinula aciculospora]|uniref:Acetyl-CoA synthetase-like protein n=1 Tax=Lentinula aciculospora TaxID=153920 RepID=A0A9W8ZWL5_9AGAR|nr:acetyl-CoA synthetase-like protein [Lentinula aciculospora]